MITVVWFKRDLRVCDHPALAHAATQGDVLPLFVFEPGYWSAQITLVRLPGPQNRLSVWM